jgi:septal ring factor EnvC (AmiA/AmiB activator)
MTFQDLKEGGGIGMNLATTVIGGILVAIFGFLITNYVAQSNEIQQHDRDIQGLKITVANISDAQRRTENSISSIEGIQTTILGTLQSLKDANDAQTAVSTNIRDQFLDLRKQIAENKAEVISQLAGIDLALRGPIAPRNH